MQTLSQTLTNASQCRRENASKRNETRANLDKRKQTLTPPFFKVARLQREFCTERFFRGTNFLTKNAPKISPNFLSLCFLWVRKNPRKIPSKFPTKISKFPCEKSKKKFTDELLQERRENPFLLRFLTAPPLQSPYSLVF